MIHHLNRPSDDVAHDAINSEINEVVVLVIGPDAECPDAEYRLVPKVPGYKMPETEHE